MSWNLAIQFNKLYQAYLSLSAGSVSNTGNIPEENSIHLGPGKVFNIVSTDLTELFKVDAMSNVSVGSTGSVATLTVGNPSSAENNTHLIVQDVYGSADLSASALTFTYGDSRVLNLLNIFTPQINLTNDTGQYTVLLSSGNDDSTSGLTITTPTYEANYTNSEMRITAISSPPLRQVIINPNSILITNGVVATTITETSITSASFVGALTGNSTTATTTNQIASSVSSFTGGTGNTFSVADNKKMIIYTGSGVSTYTLITSGVSPGFYVHVVNSQTSGTLTVYQGSIAVGNVVKALVSTKSANFASNGAMFIYSGSQWMTIGGA